MTKCVKCVKCLYRKNCQFLTTHKKIIVEDCSAFLSEKEIKAKAIKEFAERLKEKYPWKGDYLYSTRQTVENIDNLVKEMVGADNAE